MSDKFIYMQPVGIDWTDSYLTLLNRIYFYKSSNTTWESKIPRSLMRGASISKKSRGVEPTPTLILNHHLNISFSLSLCLIDMFL